MWTKDNIRYLLNTNDLAVERAIVAIYDRQTLDEKQTTDTKHTNSRGFSSAHVKTGSFYARIILKGWKQNGRSVVNLGSFKLARAREIALHYHRQLCEIANNTVKVVDQLA